MNETAKNLSIQLFGPEPVYEPASGGLAAAQFRMDQFWRRHVISTLPDYTKLRYPPTGQQSASDIGKPRLDTQATTVMPLSYSGVNGAADNVMLGQSTYHILENIREEVNSATHSMERTLSLLEFYQGVEYAQSLKRDYLKDENAFDDLVKIYDLDNPDELRAFIRQNIGLGVELIKLHTKLYEICRFDKIKQEHSADCEGEWEKVFVHIDIAENGDENFLEKNREEVIYYCATSAPQIISDNVIPVVEFPE